MRDNIKIIIPHRIKTMGYIANCRQKELFIVGGYVRDAIISMDEIDDNLSYKDIDLAGNITPDDFRMMYSEYDWINILNLNLELGTIKTIIDEDYVIEYTCYRKEFYKLDGSHMPIKVTLGNDIAQDAIRRDFTINCIYVNVYTREIVDPYNGVEDIDKKTIRTIRDPVSTFKEDALRILRMARFCGQLGFKVDDDTLLGAKECSELIKNLAYERIGVEIDRILCKCKYTDLGILMLVKSNALSIFPELNIDLSIKLDDYSCKKSLRWAIFLESLDINNVGILIRKLSQGNKLYDEIKIYHSFGAIIKSNKKNIILYLAKATDKRAKYILEYIKAIYPKKYKRVNRIYNKMSINGNFILKEDICINGNDVIIIIGKQAGPTVGKILDTVYEHVIVHPKDNNREKLYKIIKKYYKKIK